MQGAKSVTLGRWEDLEGGLSSTSTHQYRSPLWWGIPVPKSLVRYLLFCFPYTPLCLAHLRIEFGVSGTGGVHQPWHLPWGKASAAVPLGLGRKMSSDHWSGLTTTIRWTITFRDIESGPQIHDSVAEVGYGLRCDLVRPSRIGWPGSRTVSLKPRSNLARPIWIVRLRCPHTPSRWAFYIRDLALFRKQLVVLAGTFWVLGNLVLKPLCSLKIDVQSWPLGKQRNSIKKWFLTQN
jgi:hypothetical protein